MKIALIVEEFPSLSQTFVLNQIIGLIERGHEVDIFGAIPKAQPKIHPDVEKYHLLERTYYQQRIPGNYFLRLLKGIGLLLTNFHKDPMVVVRSLNVINYGRQAASLRLLYQTIPYLGKKSYNIIHCHFGHNGRKILVLRELGLLQGKLSVTFHGVDVSKRIQIQGDRIYDELFAKAELFLPISDNWKHKLIKLGYDEKKIIVHRMGIDCEHFSFIPRRLHPDGKVRLVTICRLVEKKGVEYGIRAVAELAKTQPNIEYHIIGDGRLKNQLQQLVLELNVGNLVKLHGWQQQSEIINFLKSSDIFLAPSVTSREGDQEGIPVVLMEAMARGLPVVSTQHSGIPELVKDGVSGFLVPERDVDGLVEKLNYLIEHPEVWSEMGRAGRMYVQEHHDIHKLNDRLVEIYQELYRGQKTEYSSQERNPCSC